MSDATFKKDLVASIPSLRAFARSLAGNRDRADDLVQETLAKAIAKRESYTPGTNLIAWLVTILRNQYYTEGRKRKREVADSDGIHAASLTAVPQQPGHLQMTDFL
ncbi:MAG: sigma factor, partial [Roseibium sp.]